MGNKVLGKFRKNRYLGFQQDQLDYLEDKWLVINTDGLIDVKKFSKNYNISMEEAQKFIQYMDVDQSGSVDFYKFKIGCAQLCQSVPEETCRVLFQMYDIDGDSYLGEEDMKVLTTSLLKNINYFEESLPPTIEEIENKVKSLLVKWDHDDNDQKLSLTEFQQMYRKDPDLIKVLYLMGLITKDELTLNQSEYNDIDSDLEQEIERNLLQRDANVARIKDGIEHTVTNEFDHEHGLEEHQEIQEFKWQEQAQYAPSNYKQSPDQNNPPNASLDLEYIYGYRCHDSRNNLRYDQKGNVIYHTAGVGISLDPQKMSQRHFLEHSDDITCLAVHENMCLTGQMGFNPLLIVWDLDSMRIKSIWKDQFTGGISHCCFSNDGTMVAAVGMDDDHSIAIFDIKKSIKYRSDPSNQDNGLIATNKITKNNVFDIKFVPKDFQIIMACMKEINLLTWRNGKVLSERFIWKDQKPQPVLTIAFIDGYNVTGMFSGQLFVWNGNLLDKTIKAHVSPLQAIWTRADGKGIITAGKRGIIIGWDSMLSKQFEIDTRTLNVPIQKDVGPMIISLCESQDGKLLFGTRRSEIVEVVFTGQKPSAKLLMQGHYRGELWGLAPHPNSQIFFTVGEDEFLAQWDAKNKRIIKSIPNEYAAKTCHVSPNGNYLAVGCVNGRVYIYDPNSLKKISEIKDIIDPDKETLSIVKFSPNNEVLAVGYCPPQSRVILYQVKTWKQLQIIKGDEKAARYNSLDFSNDGKYFMCSTSENSIHYFDIKAGKQIQLGEQQLRDEKWNTWTSVFGWSMQGIWPPYSKGSDINTCDRSKDGNFVITGDDFGKIKLFKYPSSIPQSGFVKYTGHTSFVCGVRFLFDGKTVISVGGDELSIFQWKYQAENVNLNIDHSQSDGMEQRDQPQANVLKQKQSEQNDDNDLFGKEEIQQGDQAGAVKPFLGELKNSTPSWYKPNKKKFNVLPQGNLQIHHAHGFRYFYILDEARDMCAFSDTGKVVFITAALGVVMNADPKNNIQTFFNKHEEDIVSFAIHPSRKIAATGQMAQAGKAKQIDIFVWDIETKEQLANFREFHLRAIVLLKFSPDGTLLLSVGQDDDNSLAIHDWQSNRLVVTSNVDKAKVNAIAWKDNEEFVTCGNKHIKFWKLSGRNISGKMGQQSGKFASQYSVIYAFKKSFCVSGSGDGNLLVWKGGSSDKGIVAHQGKVSSFVMDDDKGILYSGGMDGKIISWTLDGGKLCKKLEIISLDKQVQFSNAFGITALDVHPKNGQFLIGTSGAQIFTFELSTKKTTLLQQGHFGEELWGACASPNSSQFVSAGADKTVRIWDIETRKMLYSNKSFVNDIRAVDWATNNQFIVCGDQLGFIYLLSNTLELKDKGETKFTTMQKRQSTYWIEDIKISPNCKQVAFGAHGGASHVEIWEVSYPKFAGHRTINAGLTSALLHLDWNMSSSRLIVNSQAYEMKFVDVATNKNARSSECKDEEFATWTCKLGFPVQGIFPDADYTNVNTVCRSNSQKYLTTGEDTQKVVLFNYPVVEPKQLRKEYIGHSSHVTRVRFTYDDKFMISTGGNDKTIIIWKTDFGAQLKQDASKIQHEDDEGIEDIPQEKTSKKNNHQPKQTQIKQKVQTLDLFECEEADQGDQFMACKPWMGAIKEPTQPYYNDKKEGSKPPKVSLSIEYVYGYRAKDMRSNIWYLASGKILYNAAALGIVMDTEDNTQTFFDKHQDDITAIALSPHDRTTVATGELGAKPFIFVWDAETKEVKCKFKGVLLKGVVCLNFTPSGKRLVGGGLDVDHNLAVFDVSGEGAVVWKDKSGPDVIIDVNWNNREDSFTTVGVKHYAVWTEDNKIFKQKKGQFGKACNKLSGLATSGANTICGAADGSVQWWQSTSLKDEKMGQHKGSCDCITVSQEYVFSGGRDGLIFVYDSKFKKITEINCKELFKDSLCVSIKAIDQHKAKQILIVGTLGSDIYEIEYNTPKITDKTLFTLKIDLMHGHYCPNLQWTNEVWGLSLFNKDVDKFASCSDDATLRVWSITDRKQISAVRTNRIKGNNDKNWTDEKPDHATGDYQDSCKGRSLAVTPNDDGFVVGTKDGTMRIFNQKSEPTKVFRKAKEWVSDIKFSPDGTIMVHGSHDNALYAQEWPSLKFIGQRPMLKHSSYITHFDFSCDGVNLHSTCGAYELLFWDVHSGKQLPGGASALRDEKWHTWTVTLGWPVQGIWPECADGTDINSVDCSNTNIEDSLDYTKYFLLATGDDSSQVRILRYPSLKKASEAVIGRGHSSHVTSVKFTQDDKRIISTGGEDQCIIQWLINKL